MMIHGGDTSIEDWCENDKATTGEQELAGTIEAHLASSSLVPSLSSTSLVRVGSVGRWFGSVLSGHLPPSSPPLPASRTPLPSQCILHTLQLDETGGSAVIIC